MNSNLETKKSIIEKFIKKYSSKQEINPNSIEIIRGLEIENDLQFPMEYKYLLELSYKLYTPKLLDAISDNNIEMFDVQNFSDPNKLKEETREYEEAGMPKGYIGFANDCMGNMFCFKIDELKKKTDPAIYIFDHDYIKIEKVADTFYDWIDAYNRI
jgi:hypothetical protein